MLVLYVKITNRAKNENTINQDRRLAFIKQNHRALFGELGDKNTHYMNIDGNEY
jgi:hypothetical protein